MSLETATYLISRKIAERGGFIGSRYRVKDGRYVINNRDLSHISPLTDEERQTVVEVSSQEARAMIRQNRYSF